MALRLIYESGANNETTDITENLRLYTFEVTENAEEGSVGTSEITLDDPDGELDIVAWRRMWAYEDSAVGSNTLISYSWVADRRIERGPYRVGAGRIWRVSLVDQNAVLSFRVFRGSGASRPEETDVHRIEWMMDFVDSFGRAPITEEEFIFGAGQRQMDAVDYKGQYTIDLINDCAQQTGKNFYVYTKDNGYPSSQPTRGLWYGSDLHTAYSSPLRLTNDLTDIDSTWTFAISDDTVLERRADRVYSGAYVQYDGGAVYEQRTSTYNQFTQRDITIPAPNVKTNAKATTRAERNLDDLDTEEDRITTTVYLPASKVNFVKPGMRIQFKALHLPRYETAYNWLRVLSKTTTEMAESESATEPHYAVTLTLSTDPPASTVCGALGLTQSDGPRYLLTPNVLPSGLSNCLQIWVETTRTPVHATMTPPAGFTKAAEAYSGGGDTMIAYRITQAGDSGSVVPLNTGADSVHWLFEFGGIDRFVDVASAGSLPNASSVTSNPVTVSGDRALVIGVFQKAGTGVLGGNTLPDLSISAPATQHGDEEGTLSSHDQGPTTIVGYRLIDNASGTYTMSATGSSTGFAIEGWCYVVAAFNG